MRLSQIVKNKVFPYLICGGLVILTTLFGELLKRSVDPANIVMFYLLVVVFAAIRWGIGPAVAASVMSVLAFDFFLVPPYLTLGVEDLQYIFTFAAFLVVGIVVGTFASKVREQVIQRQTEKLHSALLSSISHDLKTPLVSITGSLTALLDPSSHLDEAGRKELLKTARAESERLNRIVNNLLDMTRMEAGVLRIIKKPCDVRDLLGVCLEQLKDKTGAGEVTIDIPAGFPEVSLDFPVIVKALFNVIDNALKYSPAGSPVGIRIFKKQNTVGIRVTDHGCGIPKDDLGRIFDKFYRVERSTLVSGSGLGLCISKGIVEAHGGRITVESEPGKGSVFTIFLPLE
jgi:two-component system sensor histidine kinase KdpD